MFERDITGIIDALVRDGHKLEGILKFSLRQAFGFASMLIEREAQGHVIAASVMRAAYHADDKVFKRFINSLE